ncbi:NRDE family protein [Marinagarivorans algicola]|uniref:NRDE family protein n=1 Tax=Marinagarivorans algicola TaxID=1513270 RepID=UPI0006B60FE6|nr:NRDE family protein [Marinagarivorans algicola]
MCTLTIIEKTDKRWLITMNRDEALGRTEGEPVATIKNNQWCSWRPVDKQAGGSWFGVMQGCALALLNRYQDAEVLNTRTSSINQMPPEPLESRGRLIEELLACPDAAAFKRTVKAFESRKFAPFDLFIFNVADAQPELNCLTWTGFEWRYEQKTFVDRFFYTSSSVDYDEAKAYRLNAFNTLLQNLNKRPLNSHDIDSHSIDSHSIDAKAVLQLHQTHCAHNPSLGFNMSRPGRHTKSICQVSLSASHFHIDYYGPA